MRFRHDPELLGEFPQLAVTTLTIDGVSDTADVAATAAPFLARAAGRLAERPESEFPEIAAWRRAFSKMGLKPTQYRCASEALLRRYKKEGELPSIHPLVDLCNAVSLAYAIPIAVFDLEQVAGDLTVTHATGTESYLSFGGEIESPEPGEVIFRDDAGNAHARRWTNRQSALSAIRPGTSRVLIVGEALHATATVDVSALGADLAAALRQHWDVVRD
ncbi:phenylalanine--tRNA ligase beta subunit-related protein [Microbacterium sp. HD4P20]|uniref:B3/B4 domain-containing protein n=1 Tax=Microbacterium sp. HD4P20 TaxID=2864874 RepID=UPI0020A298F6|nr:phenylalanine--tRNA ligase beta subunit-related protein [Microbacterium sp. HD4P20]MCP2637700.1 phenylalanine--tRNA ligase beta subunit-related protein [Microbacterium sp. HD4P20]